MGLAAAQVGFGRDALLRSRLTELIIDALQEDERLRQVL